MKSREKHLENILNELSKKYEEVCTEHSLCKQELNLLKKECEDLHNRIIDYQLNSGTALNKVN